jgi:hypothetical protein
MTTGFIGNSFVRAAAAQQAEKVIQNLLII